ncbi:hypothetical protein MASR1M46_16310 [Bacteroidales bacterium]
MKSQTKKAGKKIRENLGVIPSLLIQNLDKELEELYNKGEIRQITAIDLMLSVISLNAVMFIET